MTKCPEKGIIMYLCVDKHDRNKFNETIRNFEKEKRNYKIVNSINDLITLTKTVLKIIHKTSNKYIL